MKISTRGRYALRVMIELAENMENNKDSYIPMKEVSAKQEISLKYMERILPVLVSHKFVEGIHGKGGGYRLTREPSQYTVGEILRATENDLAPVACLNTDAEECARKNDCRTLPLWIGLNKCVTEYLDGVKLSDLVKG